MIYLQKINFWQRLEMFIDNVRVNDAASEEEKEMIIRMAQEQQQPCKCQMPIIYVGEEYCLKCYRQLKPNSLKS